jgi:hypothetical protein
MLNSILYNRLYERDEHINKILYIKAKSLFDVIVEMVLSDKIISSTINNPYNGYIIYNQIIINDVTPHYKLIDNLEDSSHLIIFLHEDLDRLKTEDTMIVCSKIKQSKVINFHTKSKLNPGTGIQYAIPKPPKINDEQRHKNLLILGQNIRSKITNADIVVDFDELRSYNDIVSLLQQYKVVACDHVVEKMLAQSMGCKTIGCGNIVSDIANEAYDNNLKINYDFKSFTAQLNKLVNNK